MPKSIDSQLSTANGCENKGNGSDLSRLAAEQKTNRLNSEEVDAGNSPDLGHSIFDLTKPPAHITKYRNSKLDELSAEIRRLGAPDTVIEAVSYAGMGWRVFPLKENEKVPEKGTHGFKDATTDTATLARWFDDGEYFQQEGNPQRNLGIATGETTAGYELVVLDVDVKDGKDGGAVLEALKAEYGQLPETLMQSTPSDGQHFLFKVPNGTGIGCGAGIFKAHGNGLDVRGIGGYIVAAPSTANGKPYRWLNDRLPAGLPDAWVKALQAECPAGGERGAVSVSSSGGKVQAARAELVDMPEDVAAALAEHAVPSDIDRANWLKVLSVASAFVGGEEVAREWSSSGKYADRFSAADFDKAWEEVRAGFNGGAPMDKGTLFNLVKQHTPGWKTPAQRRKEKGQADREAQDKAEKAAAFAKAFPHLGQMPDHLKQDAGQDAGDVAVSDEEAQRWLKEFGIQNIYAPEASEAQFIAGMLEWDESLIKPHVMKHPTRANSEELRGIIRYADGSKPEAGEEVDWGRVKLDLIRGGSDMVTRLANNIKAKSPGRLDVKGRKPDARETKLVRRVVELSVYGQWVAEAVEAGEAPNGWNLESIISQGLSRATGAPEKGTAVSVSSRGLNTGAANNRVRGGRRMSWIDRELVHQGQAVGELDNMPTSDQIETLLDTYGCRAVFDEMRGKVAVHGMPQRFTKLDDIVTAIRELAARHDAEWRKTDVTDALKLLATGTRYHPALEWVSKSKWDNVDRFGALLATVEPEDGYGEMWRIGLHRWCMGAVRCLVQPEGMRGVPTIVFYAPAGGEGKDRWQSSLCPIDYQARPIGFDPGNLNWTLAALNGWLGIFPEITTQSRKADIEHVKAFLTADKDSYTSKYEMDVNDRLRRTVYMASTNESDYLADRTGTNRRFITIAVKSINHRHAVDMQQFWAQMLHTFETAWKDEDEQTHRYWLEGEERQLLDEVNETHTVEELMADKIKALWDFENPQWKADKHRADWAVSVQAVASRLDTAVLEDASNVPQMFMKRIAREMTRLGVHKKQMRGKDGKTNYYLLPPSKGMNTPSGTPPIKTSI